MDHCAECGFTYAEVSAQDLPARLADAAARFAPALAEVPDPRRRPAPGVWSPLEYACHVRDVLRIQTERLNLALTNDNPDFTPMGREERVAADAYNAQDPQTVTAELTAAATALAHGFAALTPEQWTRTGVYKWPSAQPRTTLWLGRHTVHELAHHLADLTR